MLLPFRPLNNRLLMYHNPLRKRLVLSSGMAKTMGRVYGSTNSLRLPLFLLVYGTTKALTTALFLLILE